MLAIVKVWDGGQLMQTDPSLTKVTEDDSEDDEDLEGTDIRWKTTSH